VFITKNGDSNGLSVYYVSVYFGIMGLSEQKMDSWIPRFWQGNHRPDHETYIGWNLEWVSTCDRYINGYDMVGLKHWLPMGPTSPCL